MNLCFNCEIHPQFYYFIILLFYYFIYLFIYLYIYIYKYIMMQLFYPALLVTLMFFLSGIEKIYTFSKTTMNFSKKINISLTLSKLVIGIVILLEIIAPIIITSYTFTGLFKLLPLFKPAVISLIMFTVVATIMYHTCA
jgi:hypothetical protein